MTPEQILQMLRSELTAARSRVAAGELEVKRIEAEIEAIENPPPRDE